MAKLIWKEKQEELSNNSAVIEACKKMDVPFGCESGACGVCKSKILKGKENLNELNEVEKFLDCDDEHRLMCQAKIKEGEVEIEPENA